MQFGSIAVWRAASMLVGFGLSLVAAKYLLQGFGAAGFALYSVLIALLASMPFADLGLGAGVVNSTADYLSGKIDNQSYANFLRRSILILCGVAIVLAVVAVMMLVTTGWPRILGSLVESSDAAIVATLVLACLGISVPLGLGTRILQGAGKTKLTALLLFVGSGVQMIVLVVLIFFGAEPVYFAMGPSLSVVVLNAVSLVVSLRIVGISARRLLNRHPRPRQSGQPRVLSSAVPYFVVTLGVALTFQIQRILLAHVATPYEIAIYSLMSQVTIAVNSIVTMGSMNLWARYRALLDMRAMRVAILRQDSVSFAAVGTVLAAVTVIAIALIVPWASAGSLAPSLPSYLSAASVVFAWAICRPAILLLNSDRGLRFQAFWSVPCAVASIFLTVVLGSRLGAAGAFLASAIAILSFTYAPNMLKSFTICKRPNAAVSQ